MGIIGQSIPVRDAAMKVTGQFKYTADLEFPGMLHAKILFSPVPHARIKKIDTSRAEALEGVRGVVCYLTPRTQSITAAGKRLTVTKRNGYLMIRFGMWEIRWRPWRRIR